MTPTTKTDLSPAEERGAQFLGEVQETLKKNLKHARKMAAEWAHVVLTLERQLAIVTEETPLNRRQPRAVYQERKRAIESLYFNEGVPTCDIARRLSLPLKSVQNTITVIRKENPQKTRKRDAESRKRR
ncbi:MAG: hypothetical protein E6Q40_13060 [Cupriavidus sp.]|jgi:uncharacterized protein (DUF2461 family)|nr:MAG: hypothetical protein E6Q40_13060 [Cupriavidus sp.]